MKVLQTLKKTSLNVADYVKSRGRQIMVNSSICAVAAAAVVSGSMCRAEGEYVSTWPTPTTVMAGDLEASLATWVTVGLGIAVTVFVVRLGWKFFRSFITRT